MQKENTHERIRWACRRGMLELDLFLAPFFDNCYQSLDETEKLEFSHLLTATDPELLSWLMGHSAPEEKGLLAIVHKIRQYRLKPTDPFL